MTALVLTLTLAAPLPADRVPEPVMRPWFTRTTYCHEWEPTDGLTWADGVTPKRVRFDWLNELPGDFRRGWLCDDPACPECSPFVYERRKP